MRSSRHLRSALAHFKERLADGGERRRVIGRGLDVVEADHRDVFGHAEAGVFQGANGANGGDVVEAEDRSEVARFSSRPCIGL